MIYQRITNWCLYAAAFLMPIFFLPWTLDPLEINKQTLLIVLVLIACLASTAGQQPSRHSERHARNLANALLIICLIFIGLSAAFSGSRFLSWAGTAGQEYTSFASFLAFAVMFWLISERTKEQKIFFRLVVSLIYGTIAAGLIGLLQVFGVFLPFSFAQTAAFNTIGTANSLGIFLAIVTVLANSFLIVWNGKGRLVSILTLSLSALTLIFSVLINYRTVWIVLLAGLAFILFLVFLRAHELHHTKKYLPAMLMAAVAVLFLCVKIQPILNLPAEILPNVATSVSIAKNTLTDSGWLFGSGPGTYLFNYAKFRPTEVNSTIFWNFRFSKGSCGFLTLLPTLGLLPILGLFLFSAVLGIVAAKRFFGREEGQWSAFIILPAWLAGIVAFSIYPTNFSLAFLLFALSGLLGSLIVGKTKTRPLTESPRIKILAWIGFTAGALAAITILFLAFERFGAEYAFAKAVKMDRDGGELQEIIKQIDKAASINRFNDSYYRNLAEALLLETKAELSRLGTTQPTEEQNTYLQNLMAASINAGKQATLLEPRNVLNWLELGSLYRAYVPIMAEAGDFAVSSFQTAISLEPNNPENYVELGKTYLAAAASLEPLTVSSDVVEKQTAITRRTETFNAAETAFNKAIQLKPDYAHAHYQLALAFEQQGRLDEAIGKMESISLYNPQDVGAAFELGVLYLRRLDEGDPLRAEKILTQAIELLPSYSNAYWYLAFAFEQQGKIEAAIAAIEKVLELNPNNEMVKARLEKLQTDNSAEITVEQVEPIE